MKRKLLRSEKECFTPGLLRSEKECFTPGLLRSEKECFTPGLLRSEKECFTPGLLRSEKECFTPGLLRSEKECFTPGLLRSEKECFTPGLLRSEKECFTPGLLRSEKECFTPGLPRMKDVSHQFLSGEMGIVYETKFVYRLMPTKTRLKMPTADVICCIYLFEQHRAMIRQICRIKTEDVAMVRSSLLLAKLELEDLNLILREKASLVWACGAF